MTKEEGIKACVEWLNQKIEIKWFSDCSLGPWDYQNLKFIEKPTYKNWHEKEMSSAK